MEIWKPMYGYEASHEISNLGNVRGLPRTTMRSNGKPLNLKGKLLKQHPDQRGYLLIKPNNKTERVHRLVAMTFMPNDDDSKTEVNHKDGIKTNNEISNLEWVTSKENKQHAIAHGLYSYAGLESNTKSVQCLTLNGVYLRTFDSVTDAAKTVNGSTGPISAVCMGKKKTYKGFLWRYA